MMMFGCARSPPRLSTCSPPVVSRGACYQARPRLFPKWWRWLRRSGPGWTMRGGGWCWLEDHQPDWVGPQHQTEGRHRLDWRRGGGHLGGRTPLALRPGLASQEKFQPGGPGAAPGGDLVQAAISHLYKHKTGWRREIINFKGVLKPKYVISHIDTTNSRQTAFN